MALDFAQGPMDAGNAKARRGRVNYHAGLAAEDIVQRRYLNGGVQIVARRWRGASGEIDIIARDRGELVFIEVKKGRTFGAAAERVTPRQMGRIVRAAQEYVAGEPDGQSTVMRFDVALVNAEGETDILSNVTMH